MNLNRSSTKFDNYSLFCSYCLDSGLVRLSNFSRSRLTTIDGLIKSLRTHNIFALRRFLPTAFSLKQTWPIRVNYFDGCSRFYRRNYCKNSGRKQTIFVALFCCGFLSLINSFNTVRVPYCCVRVWRENGIFLNLNTNCERIKNQITVVTRKHYVGYSVAHCVRFCLRTKYYLSKFDYT